MSERPEDAGPLQENLSARDRVLVVVAGPNAAGKTTFVDIQGNHGSICYARLALLFSS
jgi:ABC-type uncharacterized transport system ATPase subunit